MSGYKAKADILLTRLRSLEMTQNGLGGPVYALSLPWYLSKAADASDQMRCAQSTTSGEQYKVLLMRAYRASASFSAAIRRSNSWSDMETSIGGSLLRLREADSSRSSHNRVTAVSLGDVPLPALDAGLHDDLASSSGWAG